VRPETKDKLLGMYLAIMDGRDPRHHVMMLDGDECIAGHKIIVDCDRLLKAQWQLMGAPDEQII
jgi:hypothetical protein